jgi:hypothetical protein
MEDQEKRIEENVEDTDYITAIKELKENSVSKDKYDALEAEKKKLLEVIVSGQEQEAPEEELKDRAYYYDLYKKNNFNSNLDFWDNFIKLRKATIKEYGGDPTVTGEFGFLPDGTKFEHTFGEDQVQEEQMNLIEDLIEQSNGNPIAFDKLMQSSLPRKF